MDGDGYPDLVATFLYIDSVMWFKNVDGLGGFSVGYAISEEIDGAKWVDLADVDGDGDMDVITASNADGMLWIRRYAPTRSCMWARCT